MGTSGSYGGSGGRAWGRARQQAEDYIADPTPQNAEQLVSNIADALDWDGDDPQQAEADQRRPDLSPLWVRAPGGGGGDGTGGAAGGGRGGAVRAGGAGGTGRSRSRARAASIGGSVAAAGLALRAGDADTLARFGLALGDLAGLDAFDQAGRILEAVAGSVGGIQEDELRTASAEALLALLQDGAATAADAVRIFVVEYVFAVSLTEIGDDFRDGRRPGWASVSDEDVLHDLIEAKVKQVDIPENLAGDDLQQAIYDALDEARAFLRGRS
jgi:hypothetical protein